MSDRCDAIEEHDSTVRELSPISAPIQPMLVADYGCETGENPLWHPIEQNSIGQISPPVVSSVTTLRLETTNSSIKADPLVDLRFKRMARCCCS